MVCLASQKGCTAFQQYVLSHYALREGGERRSPGRRSAEPIKLRQLRETRERDSPGLLFQLRDALLVRWEEAQDVAACTFVLGMFA
jgi:hypothetical protein